MTTLALPVVSTTPRVLKELIDRSRRVLPDVQICDGQPVPPEDAAPDLICIGFTGQVGEPAVSTSQSRDQKTTSPERESYDITCLSSSWAGEQSDPEIVRNRCYELVNYLALEVAKDQTLGGKCGKARITTGDFAQEQTTKGAVATLRFVVHIDAFTSRQYG